MMKKLFVLVILLTGCGANKTVRAPIQGTAPTAQPSATIPSIAIDSGDLTGLGNWKYEHDEATPGSAIPSQQYPVSTPSLDGASRQFIVPFTGGGGARASVVFAQDSTATHFVYDIWVLLANPNKVMNVEMDMNQVVGRYTYIFGTQCAHGSKSFEITYVSDQSHWRTTNIPCDPQEFKANTWHHFQIATHRDNARHITYDYVVVDDKKTEWKDETVVAAERLGWTPGDLVPNFQLDGVGSGIMTVYYDKMHVWRW
jgi:hypothetical protein